MSPSTNVSNKGTRTTLAALAVGILVAAVLLAGEWLPAPDPVSGARGANPRAELELATLEVPERSPASSPPQRVVLHVVNTAGEDIVGAWIESAGGVSLGTSDAAGQFSVAEMPSDELRIGKAGYATATLPVPCELRDEVVLEWNLHCTLSVVDEGGEPLAGARVWLESRWQRLAEIRESAAESVVTDAGGLAHFRGLSPGTRYIHAHHPSFVFDARHTEVLAIDPGHQDRARVPMTPLYVFAFRPVELKILSAQQRCQGGFAGPGSPLAQDVMAEAKARIEADYPGAIAYLTWRLSPNPKAKCELLVAPVGRLPFRLDATPVRLEDFNGPVEATIAHSPASNDFGSCIVTVEGVDPIAFSDAQCMIRRLSGDAPSADVYRGLRVRRRIGDLITLPAGEYRLRVPDVPMLDRAAIKAGQFTVAKGDATNIRLETEQPLFPVMLTLALPDGEPVRDYQLTYACPAFDIKLSQVITSPSKTFTRWLPSGVFSYRVYMAGPTDFESFVGTGTFTVLPEPTEVEIRLVLQKG